jgi:hypothetical protein
MSEYTYAQCPQVGASGFKYNISFAIEKSVGFCYNEVDVLSAFIILNGG